MASNGFQQMPSNSIAFFYTFIHLGLKARQIFSLGQWLTRYVNTFPYRLLLNIQAVQLEEVNKISKGEIKMKPNVDSHS
jgi:hypothetical protein